MSYPVVTIFTRKNCGPCVGFMSGYHAFKKDIESICPEAKIHVVTYDMDWKTRIFTEKYGIPDLINDGPIPDLAHLESSPMVTVVRSDYITEADKYILNGFRYSPKQRIFTADPTTKQNMRTFLTNALRMVNEDIAQNPFQFRAIAPKTKGSKKEEVSKRVEKVVAKSKKQSSMMIVGNGSGSYGAKSGKFHFEMVDTT